MVEPLLEHEKRLKAALKRLDAIERAIETMAEWLVQAQTGFNAHDAQGIKKILREGKNDAGT